MQATDQAAGDLAVQLFNRMGQINAGLAAQIGPEVERGSGLSAKAHELLTLLDCPTSRQRQLSQLAVSLLMSPSGLSRLTDRLQHDGLVERHSCPSDHRGMHVVLTPAGRARLNQADRVRARALLELLPDLTATDLQSIAAALDRIGEALHPPAPHPQAAP